MDTLQWIRMCRWQGKILDCKFSKKSYLHERVAHWIEMSSLVIEIHNAHEVLCKEVHVRLLQKTDTNLFSALSKILDLYGIFHLKFKLAVPPCDRHWAAFYYLTISKSNVSKYVRSSVLRWFWLLTSLLSNRTAFKSNVEKNKNNQLF